MSPTDEEETPHRSGIDPTLVVKYKKTLQDFKVPEEFELRDKGEGSIRHHPSEEVEAYFEWASHYGMPILPWNLIQPAFVWKVKFVMNEMLRIDRARLKEGESLDFAEGSVLKQDYDEIIQLAQEFEAAPFTWQRICELLHSPMRHYNNTEKFVRAFYKSVNVITTVRERGLRVTGADFAMASEPSGTVERHFFGSVDELDYDGHFFPAAVQRHRINYRMEPIDSDLPEGGDAPAEEGANESTAAGDQPQGVKKEEEGTTEEPKEEEKEPETREEPMEEAVDEPTEERKEEAVEDQKEAVDAMEE